MPGKYGVYEIRNLVTGSRYVGSSVDMAKRWGDHQRDLSRGVHHSPRLQHSWDKRGPGAFVFAPLLLCATALLLMYEQRCLDAWQPEYNCSPTAGSPLGVKHTAVTREKARARQIGKCSPGFAAARRIAWVGRRHTPEAKAKISRSNSGKPRTAAHLWGLGSAWRGKTMPPEHRAKIATGLRAYKMTPEHRAALSKGCLAREARKRAAR